MIITIENLPPQLIQNFSFGLSNTPIPKFNQDEEDIWKIWLYIEKKLWNKLKKTPVRKRQCEELKQKLLKTYERIKTKKKNGETKDKNKTEEPFYRLECSSRSNQEILFRLRQRSI
jgi:hypothetical protein